MVEERIFHLLRNLNLKSEDFIGNFPRLNPEYVEDVSKGVASILADTQKKGSNRISCIQFLKKICGGEEGHIRVNQSNFEAFIEASPLVNSKEDFDVNKFLREIDKDDVIKQPKSVLEEVETFYNLKLELHKKRMDKLDFINDYNQKTFSHLDYTPSRETENISENVVVLKGLLQKDSVSDDTNKKDSSSEQKILKRQSDVKFGYAVLHLNSKHKTTVIENLLCELEDIKPLKGFEHEFLKYLFKTEVNFRATLLEMYPFLLEVPIVEICTKLFDMTSYDFEEDRQFLLIKECFNSSSECKSKVIAIFYELFVLGNYNELILKPINVLNKK